jgi:hypothetical protein
LSPAGPLVSITAYHAETGEDVSVFSLPISLTLSYDPQSVAPEAPVSLFHWDENRQSWEASPSENTDRERKTVSVQSFHLSQFSVFSAPSASPSDWGEVFVYPNPAVGTTATFHIETGPQDNLTLRVYELTGAQAHEATLTGTPGINTINRKQAYEYAWNTTGVASGTYLYVIEASYRGETRRLLKKLFIAK